MSDPWIQIIETLEPEYQDLKLTMEQGPTIRPILYLNSVKRWRVTIEEVWPGDIIGSSDGRFDRLVEWSSNHLKDWPGIRRVAWDSWDFPTKREAERFVIIFNLSWSQ